MQLDERLQGKRFDEKKNDGETRNLNQMRDYPLLPAPKQYISGESFAYLGRHYRLKVLKGEPAPAKLRGG
jgi:hypothetical protein